MFLSILVVFNLNFGTWRAASLLCRRLSRLLARLWRFQIWRLMCSYSQSLIRYRACPHIEMRWDIACRSHTVIIGTPLQGWLYSHRHLVLDLMWKLLKAHLHIVIMLDFSNISNWISTLIVADKFHAIVRLKTRCLMQLPLSFCGLHELYLCLNFCFFISRGLNYHTHISSKG